MRLMSFHLYRFWERRNGRFCSAISVRSRFVTLAVAILFLFGQATAARAGGLIRDAEIEALIADYAKPIFHAAGLASQNIHIHLVNDRSFNAFVVDGQNMFIHVGAIMRSKTPNQLIGVIAHETGHIAGGHLSRLRAVVARAQSAALMFQLLGLAAIAAGAATDAGSDVGQAGSAILFGGQAALQRSILAYRRVEEYSADQAGVTFLTRTKQSARGMIETFEYFADQSLASLAYADPYVQTHPMPRDRIAQLRELAHESPYFDQTDPPELQFRHDMVRAKLEAFINRGNPAVVFRKYPTSDQSLPARYARAISRYFSSGIKAALPQINALIETQPKNPYFYELKGQFLLESGNVRQAVAPLRKAVQFAPESGLIRIMLAQALLGTGDKKHLNEAVRHLRKALVVEKYSALGYRQLATAYGRLRRIADAELASAQAYFYEGKLKLAKTQAERAKTKFPPHSAKWIRADDIVKYQPPKAR